MRVSSEILEVILHLELLHEFRENPLQLEEMLNHVIFADRENNRQMVVQVRDHL